MSGDGLREAVEALAARWERENSRPASAGDMIQAGIWSATKSDAAELRAILAAHATPSGVEDGGLASESGTPLTAAEAARYYAWAADDPDPYRRGFASALAAVEQRVADARAEGERVGREAALRDAQRVLAGEDTVTWARRAKGSSLALSHAIDLLDDLRIDYLCDCGDFDGHPGDCAATSLLNEIARGES